MVASVRGKYKSRKPKVIKASDGNNKRSPHSLRKLFNFLRETADHGGKMSHEAYAEKLSAAWVGPRYGVSEITTAIFETTEDGKHRLFYWNIEAYAREVGVPSALLLLLSRVQSELSNASPAEALLVINGMKAAIELCEQGVADPSGLDIRAVIDAYLSVSASLKTVGSRAFAP